MTPVGRLTPDTRAIVLLCGRFDGERSARPLSAREYSALAEVLHARSLRPADLLHLDAQTLSGVIESADGSRRALSAERINTLLAREVQAALAIDKWSAGGVWLCGRGDEAYPRRYRKRLGKDSPPLLYVIGNGDLLNSARTVAIVGSRDITDGERQSAARFARHAIADGEVVVSGAARGTDEEAMLAALQTGGAVAGVIAENLMRTALFKPYREALEESRMVLLSAFGVNAPFSVGNAIARNKLIYGLADRSIVVACAEGKGGTWAGATEALQRGWTVAVRAGEMLSPGNAALAAMGAVLIDDDGVEVSKPAPTHDIASAHVDSDEPASTLWQAAQGAILRALRVPKDAKELAGIIDATPKQTETWLRRLVAEGQVNRVGKKYATAAAHSPAAQLQLLQ